jgi:uncharacterized protein (TIGR03083 family)
MTGQNAEVGPPAEPPHDYTGLFLVERARLTELLASLEPADWDRPSPCPGWTVLGLCSHLTGDDLGFVALRVLDPPPAAAPGGRPAQ